MAAIINDRDVVLQAATPRINPVASDYIFLTSPTTNFKVGSSTIPSSIVITANLQGYLAGTVTFSTSPTITATPSGNTLTILPANMTSDSVVVTASLAFNGSNYSSTTTINLARDIITSALGKPSASLPADSAGVVSSFTNAANTIKILVGNVDDTANWSHQWSVVSGTSTISPITDSPANTSVSMSVLTTPTAVIRCTSTRAGYTTQVIEYSVVKATAGATGTTGSAGDKSITIFCYRWLGSDPGAAPSTSLTYTWATGAVSAYPAGWTASPPAAPANGFTLYQYALVITDSAADATTAANWNTSTKGSFGYRQDGSIGYTGGAARRAYLISTATSAPAVSPTSRPGDGAGALPTSPAGWSTTASVPTPGQYLYQVDGTYDTATNITTWGSQSYLSSLKVGSLQAITANLGIVNISADGALYSGAKSSYASATAGFWLGYHVSSSTYRLDIGSSAKYLRWDGTNLLLKGDVDTDGYVRATGGIPSGFGFTAALIGQATAASSVGVFATGSNYGIYVLSNGTLNTGMLAGIEADCVGSAIRGIAGNNGTGVYGKASVFGSGHGVHAERGTAGSGYALQVTGVTNVTNQIRSTLATGTPPFVVASTTEVPNLNAGLLGGYNTTNYPRITGPAIAYTGAPTLKVPCLWNGTPVYILITT